MTVYAYNTPWTNGNDAQFRAWVAELIAGLLAAGATQTADTGQINTATVTRPAANTAAGYIILQFNDALQATAPGFLKLEFGCGSAVNVPGFWVTAGTGTNGAGTLTGIVTTRASAHMNIGPGTAPFTTNICVKDGYIMVIYKRYCTGRVNNPDRAAFFSMFRSSDEDGANTGEGIVLMYGQTSTGLPPYYQTIQVAAGVSAVGAYYYGTVMGDMYTQSTDTPNTAMMHKTMFNFPQVRVSPYFLIYSYLEMPENALFNFTVGVSSRRYLALSVTCNYVGNGYQPYDCFAVCYD
jgi:hypothetical protein